MNDITTISVSKSVKEQLENLYGKRYTWDDFFLNIIDEIKKGRELLKRSAEQSQAFEAAGLAVQVDTTQQGVRVLSSSSDKTEKESRNE